MKPELLKKTTWECIHCTPFVEEVIDLPSTDLLLGSGDLQHARTEQDLFRAIASAFSLPEYFGNNWDALDECLTDLSWLPRRPGYVLLLRSAGQFWRERPATIGKLLQTWLAAAEQWSKEGISFHMVMEVPLSTDDDT